MAEPTIEELCNLVTPQYATNWQTIGQKLGLNDNLLDRIEYDCHHKAEDCCNALWKHWLETRKGKTWEKVIEAIELPAMVSTVSKPKASKSIDNLPMEINSVTGQLQKHFIKERYQVSADDWPSYQPEHFTSVTLIHHREKHATAKEVIAIANVMHKGEIDVPASKTSKKISDIFTPHTTSNDEAEARRPSVVLIEGAPGIGKTILSKEITFQWANGSILRDMPLVFLIFLRDPYVQQISSLEQFVCYVTNSSNKNATVESVVQHLQHTSGGCCTIIFDGYDEISEEARLESFIAKILSRKVLKSCGLVITSRPNVSACLHNFADCRVEVLGFTKEDRKEYIYRSLMNEKSIKVIEQYLEANPFIDSLCYIPLNMTILICLLKESETLLPKTQTEINRQFAFVTISRYLRREKQVFLKTSSLYNLPSPYAQQLRVLSKMAFIFLGKEKIVFNDYDIKTSYPKGLEKLSTLGLLKVVQYYNVFESSSCLSYNFLHFSMQEFLAAFYITTSSETKQLKILQDMFWNPKFLNVGIMYVGLSRSNLLVFKHFLSGSKYMITSRIFGAKDIALSTDKVKSLHLFQCFLETGNDRLLQQVGNNIHDNKIDLSGHALLIKDIHTFSFFLTRSPSKVWKEVNLSRCYIGDFGLEVFSQTFLDSSEWKIKIGNLNMSYNLLTSSTMGKLIHLVHCFNVERLLIGDNHVDHKVFDDAIFSILLNGKVLKLHVEKITNYKSSFYFINSKFDKREDMKLLCTTKGDCSLYFWKASILLVDLPALMSAIFAEFSFVSVYESNLRDDEVVEISSKLAELFTNNIQINLEFVLQSKNKLVASNTNLDKILPACDALLAQFRERKFEPIEWYSIELCNCAINDGNVGLLINRMIKQDHILFLEKFDVAKCKLTSTSIDVVIYILKFSIVKQLILSDNTISNTILCDSIMTQICNEDKILNFRNRIPLSIVNNYDDNCISRLVSNIFLINCKIDKDSAAKLSLQNNETQLNIFLFNIICDKIVDYISELCSHKLVFVSVCQANLSDEIGVDVASLLNNINKKHSFTLATNSHLLAFRAKQSLITAVLQLCGVRHFDTIQLSNCTIDFSEISKLFQCTSVKIWNAIQFSGCKIGDIEIEILCDAFSKSKYEISIKSLNLSQNSFELPSIIKLLQYCTVEKLDISPIPVDGTNFNELLLNHSTDGKVLNIKSNVSLVVHTIIEIKESQATTLDYLAIFLPSCHHFTEKSLEFNTDCKAKLCNVFFVQHELKKMTMILSIMHIISNSTVKLISFKAGILVDALNSIIFSLNKQNDCDTFIRVLDISNCRMKNEDCKQLFNFLFNETSSLKHVKEFDITSNMLTSVEILTKVLQYCIIEKLLLSSELAFKEFNDSIITEYFAQKQILNYNFGIPMVVINFVKKPAVHKNRLESQKKIATIILLNCKLDDQFYQMVHLLSIENCLLSDVILCNCLHSNGLDETLSISYKNSFPNTSIFERSVENIEWDVFCMSLLSCRNFKYGLVSSERLLMNRCTGHYIIRALELLCISSVTEVQMINCEISEEIINDFGIYLSTNFNTIAKIMLSNCTINDNGIIILCKALFSKASNITQVQMLDVSHNKLTISCLPAIVDSLQHCIIENLIISGNNIPLDEMADILMSENYNRATVSNFRCGIPLVVINAMQHSGIHSMSAYSATFWSNDEIDEVSMNGLLISIKNHSVLKQYFFLMNHATYLEPQLPLLKKFLPFSTEIIVHKLNLSDEELVHISALAKDENCKFVLASTHYLLSNIPASKLISSVLGKNQSITYLQITNCCIRISDFDNALLKFLPRKWNTIDFSGCSIENIGCATLLNWFSHHKSSEGCIKILNLSNNCLTSASISTIIELLEYCVIENIVVHKSSWFGDQFTKHLEDNFEGGRNILNFYRNIPLAVYGLIIPSEMSNNNNEANFLSMCNIYTTSAQIGKQIMQPVLDTPVEAVNVYMVLVNAKRIDNTFSVMHANSTINLRLIHNSFILEKEIINLITNLIKSKILYCNDSMQVIDISKCLNNYKICTETFKIFFKNDIPLRHIKKLDCSHQVLMLPCVNTIVESLEYCVMDYIKVSCSPDVFYVFSYRILKQYEHKRAKVMNFGEGIPLTITNKCTSQHTSKEFSCDSPHSVTFLVKCKINSSTGQAICKSPGNMMIIINCFLFNDLIDMKKLCGNSFHQIAIFEAQLCDEETIEYIKSLPRSLHQTYIEYILVNKKELIAYRAHQYRIMENIRRFPSILTLKIMDCFIPEYHLFHSVSSECRMLQSITLSHCEMDDTCCDIFFSALFSEKSAIAYLKLLDVSYNRLISSTIIKCLQFCIVEKLIISCNYIPEFSSCLLTSYCFGGSKIKNFTLGIPLVVVKNSKHTMIFVTATTSISVTFSYYSACYKGKLDFFFLNNFIMPADISSFTCIPENAELFVFERYLSEQTALNLVGVLTKLEHQGKLEYLLISDNKLFVNTTSKELIDAAIQNTPAEISHLQVHSSNFNFTKLKVLFERKLGYWDTFDLSGCSMQDEDFTFISSYFTASNSNYINTLNLSHNLLTSSSVVNIFEILKICVVKRLIISNNLMSDKNFNEVLYSSPQHILNFKLGISLSIERSVVDYIKYIYSVFLMRRADNPQILQKCFSSENGELYEIFVVNYFEKNISNVVSLYFDAKQSNISITQITKSTGNLQMLKTIMKHFYAFRLHKKFTQLNHYDIDKCNTIIHPVCHILCTTFFNKLSTIKTVEMFRVCCDSSCLYSIVKSLEFCAIRYLDISCDMIEEKELCDVVLAKHYSGDKLLNFDSVIPLTIMISIKTSVDNMESCAITFLQTLENEKCVSDLLNDVLITCALNVTVYFLQCSSLIDDLVNRLSLQNVLMSKKFKAVFYETGLTDQNAEIVAQRLSSQPSNFEIKFILTSKTKLLANISSDLLFCEMLLKNGYIDFLQITNCDIELFLLKDVFSANSRNWNTIDISGCNVGDDGLSMLVEYLTTNANNLHISTLNLSTNNLTSASTATITHLLEHCVIKNLLLSNNIAIENRISDSVYNQYYMQKSICNFVHKSLLIVKQTTVFICGTLKNNSYSVYLPSHALNIYDVEYCFSDCDGHYYELFLVGRKNRLSNVVSILFTDSILKISNYFDGVEIETLFETILNLFCKLKVLNKPISLDLFSCNLGINMFQKMSRILFTNRTMFESIKELDISSSNFTMHHLSAIFITLKSCVIKKLIIPSDYINSDSIGDLLLTQYYKGIGVLNFTREIPLVIMNDAEVSVDSGRRYANIFMRIQRKTLSETLRKHKIMFMDLIVKVIEQLLDYNIYKYKLYLIDCNVEILEMDFYSTLSLLPIIMLSKANFEIVIFETSVLETTAIELSKSIRQQSILDIKFILVSKTWLLTNAPLVQLITTIITYSCLITSFQITDCCIHHFDFQSIFASNTKQWNVIDISGCNIGDEGFEYFCDCFSTCCIPMHINELNVSQNCLTSSRVISCIVKLLQCCIVKKLIFSHHHSTYRNCVFNEASSDLIQSVMPIQNFLHNEPLVVIESVDNQSSLEDSRILQVMPCSSLFLNIAVNDVQQLHWHGFTISCKANIISIVPQQYPKNDIAKTYDQNFSCAVASQIKEIFENVMPYNKQDCLEILNVSDDKNTMHHCITILNLFINEKRFLKNVKELQITLEQFIELFVDNFQEIFKHCGINKLLVICKDMQLNQTDVQATRRRLKLKILNNIVSITLVVTKDANLAINKHYKLEFLEVISSVYLRECNHCKLKSVLQNLSVNKYVVSDILISNCTNQNDINVIQNLMEKNPCINFSLFEVYFSDEVATNIINLLNSVPGSGQTRYTVKSNTMLFANKSHEKDIINALDIPGYQLDTLHLLYCPLSKSGFYKVGIKLFKKSRFFKSIIITGTDFIDKLHPFLYKLWFKNWCVHIKVFDISSNQLTMSCAQMMFNTMKSSVIEILIVCDIARIMSRLIVTEFDNGKQLINFTLGFPVLIINTTTSEDIKHNHATVILSNCDIGQLVQLIRRTLSMYKISVCSFYLLSNNLFNYHDNFVYYCQQFCNIELYFYIVNSNIMCESCTLLQRLKLLSEQPKMKVNYFCAADTTLLGNISNHWLIHKVLRNPSIVDLQFINCNSELFNEIFCTAITSIQRQWQHVDFSYCNIGHHGCLKLTDCFLKNNSTISSLILSHNKLSEISMIPLAKLALHCEVNTLNLSCNKIDDYRKFLETFVTLHQNMQRIIRKPLKLKLMTDNSISYFMCNSILSIADLLSASIQCNNIVFVSCQFENSDSFFTATMSSLYNIKCLSHVYFYNNNLQIWQIKRIVALLQNISLHIEEQVVNIKSDVIFCNFEYLVKASLPLQFNKLIPLLPTIHFTFLRQGKTHSCKLQNFLQLNSVINVIEEIRGHSVLCAFEISSYSSKTDNIIMLEVSKLISRQDAIEYISLKDISSQLLNTICENLQHITSLKSFYISFINITDSKSFTDLLLCIIASNPLLEDFTISHCNIYDVALRTVTKTLQSVHSLKSLKLDWNLISDASAKQLATTLTGGNSGLKQLKFSKHKMDVSPFEVLNIQYKNLFDHDLDINAHSSDVSSSSGISQVQLSSSDFQEAELIAIFEALVKMSSLKAIDINSNWISDIAAQKLAELIRNNKGINCLNMLDCIISHHGITAILACLRNVSSLLCIKLNCKATVKPHINTKENICPFEMLTGVLGHHKFMKMIVLNYCTSDKVISALSEISSLQLLDLSSSTVSSHDLSCIVANNSNLQYLNISHCKILQQYLA